MGSCPRRTGRPPGERSCGLTGARSRAPTFFTTEVWTPRGLTTYYTPFVLDLQSRRVHVASSTPTPDGRFMAQTARRLTDPVDGFLAGHRVLILDRDRKWTDGFRRIVEGAGVRIVLTPVQAPNANAHAERFVRSSAP
jgi:putative transposase